MGPGAPLSVDADPAARARPRLKTPEAKAIHARRNATVETAFGTIQEVMEFRRFHLRGLNAVNGKWTVVSPARNLKRTHALAR